MKRLRSIIQWFKLMLTPTSTLVREAAETRARLIQAEFWHREFVMCSQSARDSIGRGDWLEAKRWWQKRNAAVHRYNSEVRKPLGLPPLPTPSFAEVTR